MGGERGGFPMETLEADFCVVGGGIAGICAAVAAARHGAKTVLINDRPVLGGAASSECRVHIGGADRQNGIKNLRETGILEELRMENLARNPNKNFSVWDLILYETCRFQPNLTLLLNCSCLDAETAGNHVVSVTGWQLTTEKYFKVRARIFADCSGDGVLAPLTGAEFRMGREARSEYGESIAPEKADRKTMGMTCLFQTRECSTPQPFTPPSYAYRFERDEDLPRDHANIRWWEMGYWWVELGGECDSIGDTERMRDELLRIALGVWDHIKNHGDHGAENWALEWLQFLPAKRESRRYVGAHVLTQNDIASEGKFDDLVAYGGWTMDDHNPAGFWAARIGAPSTIFHPAPSPYGIPYRALYSRNVDNLMFAGRAASCTHTAMSSTRVMGTGASMGQAAGTAAAMAVQLGVTPAGILPRVRELQQALLRDDAYLPWNPQKFGPLTTQARLEASQGDPEPLRDGVNRPVGDHPHCWTCRPGDSVAYLFDGARPVRTVTAIVNSALDQRVVMSYHQKSRQLTATPEVMVKRMRIEGLSGGRWTTVAEIPNNHQRLVRAPVEKSLEGVRLTVEETWGAPETRLYALYVE